MAFRSTSAAVLAAVPLALAGCSQGAPAPSSAPPPSAPPTATSAPAPDGPKPESVAWTNRLCELVGGFAASQRSSPPADKSSREAFKTSAVSQLDSAIRKADDTLHGIRTMRPSPIPGAESVTNEFEKGFVRVRDVLTTARNKAEDVDTGNERAFTAGMREVRKELEKGKSINFGAGFSQFNNNRALLAAAAQAPSCQSLINPPSGAPQQPPASSQAPSPQPSR
ncbi:hypothetical protein DFQ14_11272 [Halopolyspora algeriensis]|uniref:Uncharacterized protein n=1 Tax=Halopolyspora algeriensis TaxID=1500506 RepID=A0A368VHR7_9ACTN|nr:hypothetical protein [Halopolyspora algeriensis]RCW40192.1 hypothetical protein DFQ14_11272 [Halopolyspora algeriensis]TQM46326.1 hypothetical protein FHU43_3998 [Halopolyspora algeriensis]